jgi:hypothetical protein
MMPIKVKSLSRSYDMKTCRESEVIAPLILNLAVDGGHFTTRALPPPRDTSYGTEGMGIRWAPEPVKSFWRRGQSYVPASIHI